MLRASTLLKWRGKSLRHSGFSLLELMVVLAILGVMLAFVVPSVRLNPKDHTAEDLLLFIEKARAQAMADNLTYILDFEETQITASAIEEKEDAPETYIRAEKATWTAPKDVRATLKNQQKYMLLKADGSTQAITLSLSGNEKREIHFNGTAAIGKIGGAKNEE